jgi:hypothetical protein
MLRKRETKIRFTTWCQSSITESIRNSAALLSRTLYRPRSLLATSRRFSNATKRKRGSAQNVDWCTNYSNTKQDFESIYQSHCPENSYAMWLLSAVFHFWRSRETTPYAPCQGIARFWSHFTHKITIKIGPNWQIQMLEKSTKNEKTSRRKWQEVPTRKDWDIEI